MAEVWAYRDVLGVLARKDFQARYKRATLGLAWSVAVPILQAIVMAIVFSKVIRNSGVANYPIFVMSGIIPFSYFSSTLTAATSAIVDGSGLTDKVWFPRALLVIVPCISNSVGLLASLAVLLGLVPVFGAGYGPHDLLLVPAMALLLAVSVGLGLVTGALNVYFRDVKFLVQAALLVWLYVTPVLYPLRLVHSFANWLAINPLTGVVTLFHMAILGHQGSWALPVTTSIGVAVVLGLASIETYRRHDRLFVDQL